MRGGALEFAPDESTFRVFVVDAEDLNLEGLIDDKNVSSKNVNSKRETNRQEQDPLRITPCGT